MSSDRRWLLRRYGEHARTQALAFERLRVAAAVADARSEEDVAKEIGAFDRRSLFQSGPTSFSLKPAIQYRHGGVVGMTGSGKSVTEREMIVEAIACSSPPNSSNPLQRLGIEALYLETKDDAPVFEHSLAALYALGTPERRERLRGSVFLDRFTPGRVPCRPLLLPRAGVPEAYLAILDSDVLIFMANDPYSDTMRLVFIAELRLLRALRFPFDPYAIIEITTNKPFRLRLIEDSRVPRDVRDLLGNLEQVAAPQQLAALIRRVLAIAALPELAASMFLPIDCAPEPRPITVADCGPLSLPRSFGLARACAILIHFFLYALQRDPSTPLIAMVEELLSLLKNIPNAIPWVLDALRLLRSRSTALWFAAQSFDGLSSSFVEEVINNISWLVAFASRNEVADIVFPHVLPDRADRRSDDARKRAFARDLASLPTQHAVLWAKGHPAIRVQTTTIADPAKATGIPNDELEAMFDEELAAGSTIPIAQAERRIAEWRAEHLPKRERPRDRDDQRRTMRDLFGEEEEEE